MSHEKDILRARELQSLAIRRHLTDSEMLEAAELVDTLTKADQLHAAQWVYDALRRTYKRKKKTQDHGYLYARSLEREAHARIMKNAGRGPLVPSRAPPELTLGVKSDPKFNAKKVQQLEQRLRQKKEGE